MSKIIVQLSHNVLFLIVSFTLTLPQQATSYPMPFLILAIEGMNLSIFLQAK